MTKQKYSLANKKLNSITLEDIQEQTLEVNINPREGYNLGNCSDCGSSCGKCSNPGCSSCNHCSYCKQCQ